MCCLCGEADRPRPFIFWAGVVLWIRVIVFLVGFVFRVEVVFWVGVGCGVWIQVVCIMKLMRKLMRSP